ncbi:hypothetical protein EWM64_g6520 [Hericium alpestre]|uniref:Uncharacterized protein n=1 Tax=Hericium alpestre TaxID=135208 RepID=A0A4Y9ZTZ9_9AGAM|nr:hypothetical protein EWM64_g6520 [Hericium alpestre]
MQTPTWTAEFFGVFDPRGHFQTAPNYDGGMYSYSPNDYPWRTSAPPADAPFYAPFNGPENEALSATFVGADLSSTGQSSYSAASDSPTHSGYVPIYQAPFKYRTMYSKLRYPANFMPHSVAFQMQGTTQPGVTLSAIGSSSQGLLGADTPVRCADMAEVITLCIKIPGCAMYKTRIHTLSKDRASPITVKNLARQLARRLYSFFGRPSAREWAQRQRISDISQQIVLVSFYRVSRGTWQVELGLIPAVP